MSVSHTATPRIDLRIEDHPRPFAPGETLSCTYALLDCDPTEVKSVEVSILWYTEGKGDEDLAVHFFDRLEPAGTAILSQPQQVSTRLPASPLSYAGVIVKVCWCVRVRMFLAGNKKLFVEMPFQLGFVPPPQEIAP